MTATQLGKQKRIKEYSGGETVTHEGAARRGRHLGAVEKDKSQIRKVENRRKE